MFALLADNGIEAEDALILRRVQGADGRSRAFINDIGVSVQLLRQVGQALVEIHGQHDDRALIDPSGHRDLVDAFGGLGGEAARVAEAYDTWQRAEAERTRHESGIAATRANADYLSHALEELGQLDPQGGEEEALAARRQLMMNAEKIAAELNEALDALQGEGTGGARLAAALRRIERQAPVGGTVLTLVAEALERVLAETETARARSRRLWPRPPSSPRIWSAPRSGCSRCARSPASTRSRSTICRRWSSWLEAEFGRARPERGAAGRADEARQSRARRPMRRWR